MKHLIIAIFALSMLTGKTSILRANPVPDPMAISEFSTTPDWIEVYGYAGSLMFLQFTVNGDTVRVKRDVIEKLIESIPMISRYHDKFYFFLDGTNTTGFDLPENGGTIKMQDYLDYGIKGLVPAPPRDESSATTVTPDIYFFHIDEKTWSLDESPTPGQPNDNKPPYYGFSAVVINEILPGSNGGQFIELCNNSRTNVDIGGWNIISNERLRIPTGVILTPGEIKVYNAPFFPSGFQLPQSGGRLYLQNADGTLVESFGWSEGMESGRSFVRYPDGFATNYFSWNRENSLDFRESASTPGEPNSETYPLTSIVIEQDSAKVIPGGEFQFYCRGTDSIGQNFRMLPQWNLDGDFATVNEKGIITGITSGNGTISASYNNLTDTSVVIGTVAGTLNNNADWSAKNNPYYVTDNFVISGNTTLTIEPGVKILFSSGKYLSVSGCMQVNGEEDNPVVFTSVSSNPAQGDWSSIRVDSAASCIFRHCIIEYGTEGLYLHGSRNEYAGMPVHEISYSIFRNNSYSVKSYDAKAQISNCLFTGDSSGIMRGIFLSHSDSVNIVNNTFAFLESAINLNYSQPRIINNCIYSCNYGISAFDGRTPVTSYNNIFATTTPYTGGYSELNVMSAVNARGDSCDVFRNISSDPRFADISQRDFRLRPGSLCIDSGDPSIRDDDGTVSDIGCYTGILAVRIEDADSAKPSGFELRQNYPNPFNPVTTISYSIPKSSHISLSVYSISGQKVASLVNGFVESGNHEITFDGLGLASGVYLYRFEAQGFNKTGRMLLMK